MGRLLGSVWTVAIGHFFGRVFNNIKMIVTEARQSIRESLRIFNKMQCFLNARISLHFEDIINHQYKLLNNDSSINLNYHYHKQHDKSSYENVKNHRSCGNSMNCLVSLFLSLKQISHSYELNNIINGNNIINIISNSNMIIFG